MQPGEEITVVPTELVAGGEALARVDGFPIFVSNAFPQDVVVVRLYEVKKGFAKAETVRVVTPSPLRRLGPCPVANECGGCDWTALRLDVQLEAKRRILVESLRRIGKFAPASLPPITIHPSPLNYRIRSRLHRDGDKVGFYAMRSNTVVQLPEECEVVGLQTAKMWGEHTGVILSREDGEGSSAGSFASLRMTPGGAPLTLWEIDGAVVSDFRELTITVDAFTYRLSSESFFQVNRHLLPTLLHLVDAHAQRCVNKNSALDLYAGVGFFTLPLARRFEKVTAIEGSPESAKYGRMNVPANVRFLERAVERASLSESDFIFLDPPRAGARKEVIAAVGAKAREMICYLSCDPVTFARDANRLNASGWRLATLDLLDLFPNTHHVETLSSFERAR